MYTALVSLVKCRLWGRAPTRCAHGQISAHMAGRSTKGSQHTSLKAQGPFARASRVDPIKDVATVASSRTTLTTATTHTHHHRRAATVAATVAAFVAAGT